MAIEESCGELRLLCSYGRSTSDVCRRAGINRQQFNKYLNGHARPSLPTLRRLADFSVSTITRSYWTPSSSAN